MDLTQILDKIQGFSQRFQQVIISRKGLLIANGAGLSKHHIKPIFDNQAANFLSLSCTAGTIRMLEKGQNSYFMHVHFYGLAFLLILAIFIRIMSYDPKECFWIDSTLITIADMTRHILAAPVWRRRLDRSYHLKGGGCSVSGGWIPLTELEYLLSWSAIQSLKSLILHYYTR